MTDKLVHLCLGDCAQVMADMPDDSVDLVFGSPPYENARNLKQRGNFNLTGASWVAWMVEVTWEAMRVSKGLVAWVVEGRTHDYRYTCTPQMLMADLHRAGACLRKPLCYKRYSIPGSGGQDWVRNDWEHVICVTPPGKLPWSDPTACGHRPKYGAGGGATNRNGKGQRKPQKKYAKPEKANPGNVIDCGAAGGGNIGDKLAHENEAPFPEQLAEFMVRSWCPEGGIVLDPFVGSGTTMKAALKYKRRGIGIDTRRSQLELSAQRLSGFGDFTSGHCA